MKPVLPRVYIHALAGRLLIFTLEACGLSFSLFSREESDISRHACFRLFGSKKGIYTYLHVYIGERERGFAVYMR